LLAGHPEESRISMIRALEGYLNAQEQGVLMAGMTSLASLPIRINDMPAIPLGKLESAIYRDMRQRGTKLTIVDYLQLVTVEADSRAQEVARVSHCLQACARTMGRECGGLLVGISQLSRFEGLHPDLRHLKESGEIENDCDMALLLSNEGDGHGDVQRKRLRVGKQRNGPCRILHATFLGPCLRFENEVHGSNIEDYGQGEDDESDAQPRYGRRKK
jgi:replicative DNA helicase